MSESPRPGAAVPPAPTGLAGWLYAFRPAPIGADWRERVRVVAGAMLGILVTAFACHALAGPAAPWPWLVAPMGASALLVFGVPASPLAQPWAVVGGNTLSALVGILCARWIGTPELAATLAIGVAISLMFALRCLHPPGAASALLVALTGVTDPWFAVFPVLLNALLLAAAGIAYNTATRRAYPHMQLPAAAARPGGPAGARSTGPDATDEAIDAVLARYNQVLDVSRDDLKALLEEVRLRTYQRALSTLRCRDIMSRRLITVTRDTPQRQAWALFGRHHIKALPVVDAAGGIVGIVTRADFMRAADGDRRSEPGRQAPHGAAHDAGVAAGERVGGIMTRQVRVASEHRHLVDLIPLFGSSGHHHIPIVDTAERLVGIVTQSDVVAALGRIDAPPAGSEASGS